MTYLPADYTKVDAAIAKANALKKDEYKDFSAVQTAVDAVARGKNITEQREVDAMAVSYTHLPDRVWSRYLRFPHRKPFFQEILS